MRILYFSLWIILSSPWVNAANQKAPINELPDDVLLHTLGDFSIDIDNIFDVIGMMRMARTSKQFNAMVKLPILRRESRLGVQFPNGHWYFWPEARALHENAEPEYFNNVYHALWSESLIISPEVPTPGYLIAWMKWLAADFKEVLREQIPPAQNPVRMAYQAVAVVSIFYYFAFELIEKSNLGLKNSQSVKAAFKESPFFFPVLKETREQSVFFQIKQAIVAFCDKLQMKTIVNLASNEFYAKYIPMRTRVVREVESSFIYLEKHVAIVDTDLAQMSRRAKAMHHVAQNAALAEFFAHGAELWQQGLPPIFSEYMQYHKPGGQMLGIEVIRQELSSFSPFIELPEGQLLRVLEEFLQELD